MTFTQSLITHTYKNADLTPAAGEVVFTLQQAMSNGGVTLAPASRITTGLDGSGSLSQALTSTEDPDTIPQEPMPFWRVDERIAGASIRTFDISVPSGGASADLGTLMPFALGSQEPGGED